jgi:hypothetical protein
MNTFRVFVIAFIIGIAILYFTLPNTDGVYPLSQEAAEQVEGE